MSYPTIRNRTETPNSASTTVTCNFGTNVAGDLCVIFIALNDTAQTITTTESFTNFTNTSATFHVIYKVLDGTEGTSTTVTVGSSTKSAVIAYTITAGTHASSIAPAISTVATGTSTAPNATSCAPSGSSKDYLWISAFRQNGEEADDDTWCTAAPSTPGTFTNLTQTTTGTSGLPATNGSIASAEYQANATSVDAGAFTVAQSLAWRAYTVAVYPIQSGTFAADSVINLTNSGTFGASSIASKTQSGSFGVSAYLQKTTSSTLGISAIVKSTLPGSFGSSAIVKREQSGSSNLSSFLLAVRQSDFSLSADIRGAETTIPGDFGLSSDILQWGEFSSIYQNDVWNGSTFDASAWIRATYGGSFTASAVAVATGTGSFAASAIVSKTYTPSVELSAVVTNEVRHEGSLSASAIIKATVNPTFTLSSNIGEPSTTYEFTFGLSSVTRAAISGAFSASSIALGTRSGSFAISSLVSRTQTGSFGISAYNIIVVSGSFDLSAIITMGGSFPVDALVKKTITGSFGISARVREPEYVVPQTGDKIVIAVDAVDLTESVIFSRTEFVSQVNGVTGTCRIVVVDRDRSLSFTVGQRIYVTINNLRVWTGYIARVKRIYPFEAHSPQDRLIEIEGVDINVLFAKRIVYNKTNPLDGEGPTYPAHTDDTTALHDLFYHYLDLSEDDLNLSAKVSHVGTINEDQPSNEIVPSSTWADSMRLIGSILSPIWYINPDRQVVWADVDIEDAPFDLSDNPSGAEVGVASLTIYRDASSMINDVLLLGAGNGSAEPVYKHLASNSSIAEHGLFQYGNFVSGVWKQATIDRIASSYINGSPSSKRGHKEDRISATCTVYQHGLRAGNKVHLTSDVWGFDDIIPIRQLRLRWISPDQPKYELTLSHELDTTWNLFDPPILKLPKRIPPVDLPPRVPPPKPGGCTDEICGITDTFTRTVSGGWGTSDAGIDWSLSPYIPGSGALTYGVNGTTGWVTSEQGGELTATLAARLGVSFTMQATWRVDRVPSSASTDRAEILIFEIPSTYAMARATIWISSAEGKLVLGDDADNNGGIGVSETTTVTKNDWAANTYYTIKWERGAGVSRIKVWETSSTEPDWDITLSSLSTLTPNGDLEILVRKNSDSISAGPVTLQIDNLDISGVNRCTSYKFDNFNRTVASGWGTSSSGYTWTRIDAGETGLSVNGSSGVITTAGTTYDQNEVIIHANGPWGYGQKSFAMSTYFKLTGATTYWSMVFGIGFQSEPIYCFIYGAYGYGNPFVGHSAGGDYQLPSDFWKTGSWYFLKWEYNPSGISRVKVWENGTSEPDWQVSGTNSAASVRDEEFSIYLNEDLATASFEFDYIDFDYDGKPCYQTSCGITDTFTRTVTNEWGTSDAGIDWHEVTVAHNNPYPNSYLSVNGSQAVAGFYSGGGYLVGRLPIPDWTGDCVASVVVGGFSATKTNESAGISFNDATTGWWTDLLWASINNYEDNPYIELSGSDNTWDVATLQSVGGPAHITGPINLKMMVNATTYSAKAWLVGTSEPDWQVSASHNVSLSSMSVALEATNITKTFDNLDISGVRLCGPCDGSQVTAIDDFSNRTVNPTNIGSSIWGSTSDSGNHTWMNTDMTGLPTGSVMMVESDSGETYGRIALKSTVTSSSTAAVSLNVDGTNHYPSPSVGDGIPLDLFTQTTTTYLIDFKINDKAKSYLEFTLHDSTATVNAGVLWWYQGSNGTIGLDTYDSGATTTAFTLVDQTWYTGKLSIVGGTAMVKVWERGTTEPDWILTRTTDPLPWTPGAFVIVASRSLGDTLSSNFYITDFRMYATCVDIPPAVGSSAPTSGYYCEHIPYIGAQAFFTSAPYTPGTLRVSVDGLRQAGFTETTPTTGAFTANYDLTGSHDLWVCYLVASTN